LDNSRFNSRQHTVLSAPVSVGSGVTGDIVAAIAANAPAPGAGSLSYGAQAIAVVGYSLTVDTAGASFKFITTDGTTPADLTGAIKCGQYADKTVPQQPDPLFQTLPGQKLQIAAAGGAVAGFVNYVLLPGKEPF